MPKASKSDPGPFGRYLRRTRDASGLSRQQVADASGLSYAYLSQLESGVKTAPSPRALVQLARGTGIPVEDLAREAGTDLNLIALSEPAHPAVDEPAGLTWYDNPAWRQSTGTSTSAGAKAPELAAARAEVLPALRRLLEDYSPTTRLALLVELQAAAVDDLMGESGR